MDSKCCICKSAIDSESAAILTMSGYGTPRYICEGCDAELSLATSASELSEIGSAMDRISKKMTENNVDEALILTTVQEIMKEARGRAEKIKSGEYDFSEEMKSAEESCEEDIPEELQEIEEDRELDRKEADRKSVV